MWIRTQIWRMFLLHACLGICVRAASVGLCKTDEDCYSGYYCTSLSRCGQCIDCSDYNRRSPPGAPCVKEWKGCGPCLPGFLETELTQNRVSEFCVGSYPDEPEWLNSIVYTPSNIVVHKSSGAEVLGPMFNLGVAVTMCLVAASAAALYLFVYRNTERTALHNQRDITGGVVRYASDTRVVGGIVREPKNFLTQGALPFALPDVNDPSEIRQHLVTQDNPRNGSSETRESTLAVSEGTSQTCCVDPPLDEEMFQEGEDMGDPEDSNISGMSCYSSSSTLDCADMAMIEGDSINTQLDMVVCTNTEPSGNPPQYFHVRRDVQFVSRMDSLRLSDDD